VALLLLDHGAKIDEKNPKGATPLLTAVVLGEMSYAAFLLDHHANPNIRNKNGDTPLTVLAGLESWTTPEIAQD
jgi:ankyrin repeat protein